MAGRLLVVKATHASDDAERAHLACNIAATGVAGGFDVHLFLAVEGVRLALPPAAGAGALSLDPRAMAVPDAPPIADLLEAVYSEGTVTVCTPCAARRGLAPEVFRPGTVMGGSAMFVELATRPEATALVY